MNFSFLIFCCTYNDDQLSTLNIVGLLKVEAKFKLAGGGNKLGEVSSSQQGVIILHNGCQLNCHSDFLHRSTIISQEFFAMQHDVLISTFDKLLWI